MMATTPLWVLLQGIPFPEDGQDAWPWIAFVLAVACGALFWQLLKAKDENRDDHKAAAERCSKDLSANNTSIDSLVSTVEKQRVVIAEGSTRLEGTVTRIEARLEKLETLMLQERRGGT